MELRLSPELRQQIEAKALSLNLDLHTVVAVLLKLGLRAQDEREEELQRLAQALPSSTEPEEQGRLGEQLGEMLFAR
jgi:hypothetical protein